jgi:hypothetical protein
MPELYATVTIRAEDEMRLQRVDVKPYLATRINPTDHFHHARNIRVRSRFHYNLRERYIHYRDAYDMEADWEDGDSSGGTRFRELTRDIISLLKRFENQRLQSFRSAVPLVTHSMNYLHANIAGTAGYLNSRQNSIEALTLITDGGCHVILDSEDPIDLSGFSSLREISWTGLQSPGDFDALSSALENNTARLEQLDDGITRYLRAVASRLSNMCLIAGHIITSLNCLVWRLATVSITLDQIEQSICRGVMLRIPFHEPFKLSTIFDVLCPNRGTGNAYTAYNSGLICWAYIPAWRLWVFKAWRAIS